MKVKLFFFLVYLFLHHLATSQDAVPKFSYRYQWILYDTPNQYQTIRQNVTNLQTANRLIAKGTKKYFSSLGHLLTQASLSLFVIIPMQQSQAQRAVLTNANIKSDYRPYYFKLPEPSAVRVSDPELQTLKTADLATFRRLFSVGSESNFLWLNQYNRQIAFGYEEFRNISVDYILRTVISYSYYLPALLSFLEKDYVNNSSLGQQRITNISAYAYMYNSSPNRSFKRNIEFSDLTSFEQKRIKSVAYLSFTNLISTILVSNRPIDLGQSMNLHFALSQFLSPAGEVYNQSFWFVKKKNQSHLEIYSREIVNGKGAFPGGGIGLYDLPIGQALQINVIGDLWSQPRDLGYYEQDSQVGGALELQGAFLIKSRKTQDTHGWLTNFSLAYKSAGFKPGILNLDKGWIFSFGLGMQLPK